MDHEQFDAWTIWEHEQTLENLQQSYKCKEFRKDLKRGWGFKCSNCDEKVSSKTHHEYWGFTISFSQQPVPDLYRFCSKECGDVIYNGLYQKHLNEIELIKQKYR
ncbi:hypothetical protein ACOMCU_08465 [Lysinibacillus sp. UGB7]|uniref:hypothetical protein n=1 Tax=Lysinibacillus sp. UGB7 TaxID=3411039 RepID=UPI003B7FDA83